MAGVVTDAFEAFNGWVLVPSGVSLILQFRLETADNDTVLHLTVKNYLLILVHQVVDKEKFSQTLLPQDQECD